MSVYIYAEHGSAASELVTAANTLGRESVMIMIGQAAPELLVAGATRAIVIEGAQARSEDYAGVIAQLVNADDAELLLVESSVRGREIAAVVAAKLGRTMLSDISEISIDNGVALGSRTVYGGTLVSTNAVKLPCVATVAAAAYEAKPGAATSMISNYAGEPDARIRLVSEEPIPSEGIDLSDAERIVGVGLGFDKQEDLSLADELAKAIGAEIGCSRDVAENRRWLPKSRYIGITGVNASPDLYLAVGVSGQMQHVYGVRSAKIIAAVNSSKDAPIFRSADYGIVGDLYDIVPKLTAALS